MAFRKEDAAASEHPSSEQQPEIRFGFGVTNLTAAVISNLSTATTDTGVNVTAEEGSGSGSSYLRAIRMDLLYVILPIIVVLGTVGNLLALCVLVRRKLRAKSVYFYLSVLAVTDTTVIYVGAFRNWIRLLTGFKFLHLSVFSCKFVIFVIVFSQHLSAWLIVLLTFDRFLSVWHPFYATSFCSVKRARVMTLILFVLLIVYNMHIFWTFTLFDDNGYVACTIHSNESFLDVYEYMKAVTYCLLPSVIVLFLNSCIIYKVMQRKNDMKHSTNGSHGQAHDSRRVLQRNNRVTSMLLVISFVWLGLTTPYGIISISHSLIEPLLDRQMHQLLKTLGFILFYLNHSINFYLYCLTGQKIRTEFLELLGHVCRCAGRCGEVGQLPGTSMRSTGRSGRTQRTPMLAASHDVELKVIEPAAAAAAAANPSSQSSRKPSIRTKLLKKESQAANGRHLTQPTSGSF